MATAVVNTVWYVNFGDGSTTGYYAVAKWATNTAYTVGQIIRQKTTPTVGQERCYVVITAGTSSATTEPTWGISKGSKTTDAGGPVYMECGGLPGLNADLTNTPLSSQNRSAAQVIGNLITNNTQDHYFICTSAGTTGSSEPTFNTTTGGTTVDGCTWTCLGAVSSFTTKWAAPIARIWNSSLFGSSWAQAGNVAYVSSIHAESSSSASTTSFGIGQSSSIAKIVCISNTGNIPPQSGDVTTGASVSSSATVTPITTAGTTFYWQGISLNATATSGGIIVGNSSGDYFYLQNGAINFTNSSNASTLQLTNGRALVVLQNVTIGLSGNASQGINFSTGNVVWKDTPNMLSKVGSNWPTTLFSVTATGAWNGTAYFENCDLSAFGGTQYFGTNMTGYKMVFNKCKFASGVTIVNVANISAVTDGFGGGVVDLIDCDSGGNTYRHERYAFEGQHAVSTSAVYTGGATNGTTSYSWHVQPSSRAVWVQPFECMPMAIWNTVTGSNRTVTLQGVYNGTALPKNDEIWIDACYFGTSSSTLGTRISETKSNYLASGSNLTANTSAVWNSAATARANTHAYSVGDLISVGTAASGQLYICTTAGTSSGSVPGGYASCSDGSSVTDGTAVFRAMMRFQMSVTMSAPQPQSAGYFNVYVRAALASAEYFVDPSPVLS